MLVSLSLSVCLSVSQSVSVAVCQWLTSIPLTSSTSSLTARSPVDSARPPHTKRLTNIPATFTTPAEVTRTEVPTATTSRTCRECRIMRTQLPAATCIHTYTDQETIKRPLAPEPLQTISNRPPPPPLIESPACRTILQAKNIVTPTIVILLINTTRPELGTPHSLYYYCDRDCTYPSRKCKIP